MESIRKTVEEFLGTKVLLISDEGRNIIREEIAVISEAYDSVFILEVFKLNKGIQRESFRYADVLTKEVELNSIETHQSIFNLPEA